MRRCCAGTAASTATRGDAAAGAGIGSPCRHGSAKTTSSRGSMGLGRGWRQRAGSSPAGVGRWSWRRCRGWRWRRPRRRGWCKVIADWTVGEGAGRRYGPSVPPAVLAEVVRQVHAAGGRVAVHSQHSEGCAAAVAAGADSLEHGMHLATELLDTMARQGTALVPTLLAFAGTPQQLAEHPGPEPMRSWKASGWARHPGLVRAAYEAGVTVLAGTDSLGGPDAPHGRIAQEIGWLARAGVPAEAALGGGSWIARRWLGLPGLEEGAPADVVAYRADPRRSWRCWRSRRGSCCAVGLSGEPACNAHHHRAAAMRTRGEWGQITLSFPGPVETGRAVAVTCAQGEDAAWVDGPLPGDGEPERIACGDRVGALLGGAVQVDAEHPSRDRKVVASDSQPSQIPPVHEARRCSTVRQRRRGGAAVAWVATSCLRARRKPTVVSTWTVGVLSSCRPTPGWRLGFTGGSDAAGQAGGHCGLDRPQCPALHGRYCSRTWVMRPLSS